mmetsp:Transcript_18938/g.46991  ORF Transcript_18938/g.46991 Transcript_18938/m.46991 type:complete len:96 (-) Transcript_18938:7-294(-)
MLLVDANSEATVPAIRMGKVSINTGTPPFLSCRADELAHDANTSFPHDPPPSSGKETNHRRQERTAIFATHTIVTGMSGLHRSSMGCLGLFVVIY